jgi:hypothetical protein
MRFALPTGIFFPPTPARLAAGPWCTRRASAANPYGRRSLAAEVSWLLAML